MQQRRHAWLEVEHCATGCAAGVCTDPTCTPGATRCHGNSVETCNAGAWEISVQYPDHLAPAQQLTVSANGQASANFTLAHI